MSQYTAPGGGIIYSGNKLIDRKVVIATGENPNPPGGKGRLTNVSITHEAGGIRRGIYEYTQGGSGDAGFNVYGKKIELMGGSREVPIYNHPRFKELSTDNIITVQSAAEERPRKKKAFNDVDMDNLYQCLIRQIEYYISPSLVARVSEIESTLPSVSDLCKISNPTGVSKPGDGKWIITGISATALGDKFEVTREYTYLEQPDFAVFLYE